MKQNQRFHAAESRDNAGIDSAEAKKRSGEPQDFFARLVREHKSTIYTVCYMFSNDEDEVNDLFQETLINMW